VPMRVARGPWATAHEARTDWATLLGLVFLLAAGAGSRSVDARIARP
jgi:putative oxidoreductase